MSLIGLKLENKTWEANGKTYKYVAIKYDGTDTYKVVVEEVEAATKTIKVQFVDADTKENVGEAKDFTVGADVTIVNYSEIADLVPEGYTMTLGGDFFVEDVVTVEVHKNTTKTFKVQFVDADTKENVGEAKDVTVGADVTIVNYSEIADLVPEGYTMTLGGDFFVEDVVTVEVHKNDTPTPSEKITVEITFVDENGNVIGKGEAVVDKDATEVLKSQVTGLPDGYTIEGDSFAISGTTANVAVKKTETPSPEQATSTVTINFMRGQNVAATQAFTVTGKKGDTFTVTKADVDASVIPSAYNVYKYFDDTTVAYGENVTLQVELKAKNSGNGGGSGSSGGGSSVSTGASGVLTAGTWKLDDKGWWYQYTNNTYAKNGWYTLEWQNRLDWYYFDAEGYLVSGWYTDANGNRFYLYPLHDGTFGRMYTGWNKVDGAWQFFNDNTEAGVYGAWQEGTPVPAELANA